MTMKNIVTQNQRDVVAAYKITSDDERIGEAAGLGL
jgi:hypothetical protein